MLYRDFATQDEIDRQYDLSRFHPNPGAVAPIKAAQSDQARATLPCTLDISYGPSPRQRLDVFPAATPNAPILIFIHGGYWKSLTSTKETSAFVALGMRPLGVTTVLIEYDLCPDVTIGTIGQQVREAVAWVRRNADQIGGDPARVYVTGSSAGGHLTGMVACTDWNDFDLPPDTVAGATAISGLYDLGPFQFSFLQPVLNLDAARIAGNSPLHLARSGGCPLQLFYGGQETPEFERQAKEMNAAWIAVGNRAETAKIPDKDHYTITQGFLEQSDGPFKSRLIAHMTACLGAF